MLQLRLLHSYGPIAQTDFTVDQMIKVHLLARSVEAVEVNGYTIKPGANLTRANLKWAKLEGAKLTRAHLIRAHLIRANPSRTDLEGADLTRANLRGANLDRAVADRNTIWPEGFDPKAAGVIFY